MNTLVINDMFVDVSRCQLHKNDEVISLEPKIVQVLVLLAQHQGKVVSHQTLQNEVWPNTVVEPNALQRCIGQLRKAFDDNAKDQKVIATFPKKGYSLVPQVTWQEDIQPVNEISQRFTTRPAYVASVILLIIISLAAGAYYFRTTPVSQTAEEFLIPIPEPSDFVAMYSPDGRYVVYPRLNQNKETRLWARDLISEQEFLLTANAGNYTYFAWSPDSRQIAYIDETDCFSLFTLTLSLQMADIDHRNRVMNCQQNPLVSPQWLSSETLAVIEYQENGAAIIQLDSTGQNSSHLYFQTGKTPYSLLYSQKTDELAFAQYAYGNRLELVVLTLETRQFKVIYSNNTELAGNFNWHPTWNQDYSGILITEQEQTLIINLDGTATRQVSPYLPSQPEEL